MHLLPILFAEAPTPDEWAKLGAARVALGHEEQIRPARALPGSPGRILAVGVMPDWICEYGYVKNLDDPKLQSALGWCLGMNEHDESGGATELLSRWLECDVTFVGEEEYYGDDGL